MSGAATGPLAELALETGTVLIGDLHLDVAPTADGRAIEERERFVAWLDAFTAPRLVVLGDLFDAWVGPAHARLPGARDVVEAFGRLTRRGTALDVIHGNRDFLLDGAFERSSGGRVHPRGFVGVPAEAGDPEQRLLLIHGDELCSRDLAYQRLKRVLRSGAVTWAAPRVPAPLALWVAKRLRRASVQALARKPAEEKTQQLEAVLEHLGRHRATTVVCGHAHRFRDEAVAGGGRWIVVGAWGGPSDQLRLGPSGRLSPIDGAP